jgi:hypothetical protein
VIRAFTSTVEIASTFPIAEISSGTSAVSAVTTRTASGPCAIGGAVVSREQPAETSAAPAISNLLNESRLNLDKGDKKKTFGSD